MHTSDHATVEFVPDSVPGVSAAGLAAFQQAKVGLTAHWGLYSILGGSEWAYFLDRHDYAEYSRLTERFNPSRFNAEEWGDLLLEAGMRFFLITTKHHDGFCLWDTDLTDFKVTNSAFKRDILAELAVALRDRGIAFYYYYSLLDWTHPAYRHDWDAYVAFYQGQLRELFTRYGKIGSIVFDGYWPRAVFSSPDEQLYFPPRGAWDLAGTYSMIHELQPDCVIGNNTHVLPLAGEDVQFWELDLPGENTIGFNTTEMGNRPAVTWFNINGGWGYCPPKHHVMPIERLTYLYRRARQHDAVFYLNVGPRPFGDIHPEEQMRLREFGAYLRQAGE